MIIDFTPARAAQMTQGEMANICDVSRVTVNKWCNGKGVHRLHQRKIKLIMRAIELANAAEQLPLPEDTPHEKRIQMLRMVVARYLAEAKAQ